MIASPTSCVTETAGIVIAVVPPPIEITPSTLFTIMTPTAPEFCAFSILSVKLQLPLLITTILPCKPKRRPDTQPSDGAEDPSSINTKSAVTGFSLKGAPVGFPSDSPVSVKFASLAA